MRAEVVARLHNLWRKSLGCHYDEAVSSLAATVKFTRDPDPGIRASAFGLLTHHWAGSPEREEMCKETIKQHLDVEVRCAAVAYLGKLYRATANREVAEFLARIARDEAQAADVRGIAYMKFFRVWGMRMPLDDALKLAKLKDGLFPEGLDWSVIDSLLSDRGDNQVWGTGRM